MNRETAGPPSSRSFPIRRAGVAAAVGFGVVLAACALWTRVQANAVPDQPIAYSHEVHLQAGIQCLYCHSGAQRTALAGIPSADKCMGCHAVIAAEDPEILEVAEYADRGEPIPWVRVNRQPDFVFFAHQPHLGAGLNCEVCHGNVSQMSVAQPVVRMDMGWCLECHLDQPEEEVARLADCVACHK